MGQVLHCSATPTKAVRRANQHRQASLRALSKRYGINPKTVAKSKQRTSVADPRTGPKDPRSTVLSPEDEAIVVAFRRHTLLPLDASLYALQATILLTRSSLRRCLQRHGISRLPEVGGDKPKRSRFKAYPLGDFHIDLAEVHTAEGRLYLLVAIDRTTQSAFVELHEKAIRQRCLGRLHHQGGDRGRRDLPSPQLRVRLRPKRYRPSPDQAAPPLDQRSGRANEPHDQGHGGQGRELGEADPEGGCLERLLSRARRRACVDYVVAEHGVSAYKSATKHLTSAKPNI